MCLGLLWFRHIQNFFIIHTHFLCPVTNSNHSIWTLTLRTMFLKMIHGTTKSAATTIIRIESFGIIRTSSGQVLHFPTNKTSHKRKFTKSWVYFSFAFGYFMLCGSTPVSYSSVHVLILKGGWETCNPMARLSTMETDHCIFLCRLSFKLSSFPMTIFL